MKKETKNDIKETFNDLLLVAVCFAFALSLNKGCSRLSEQLTFHKSEKVKTAKDSIANYVKTNNQQKNR